MMLTVLGARRGDRVVVGRAVLRWVLGMAGGLQCCRGRRVLLKLEDLNSVGRAAMTIDNHFLCLDRPSFDFTTVKNPSYPQPYLEAMLQVTYKSSRTMTSS